MGRKTIDLSDLCIHVTNTIPITPPMIRWILSRDIAWDTQTLDECLNVAANFTAVTHREMAMVIFSEIPRDPSQFTRRTSFSLSGIGKIAVPNLGDMGSVHLPTIDSRIYCSELARNSSQPDPEKRVTLFFPIVNLHTHPGTLGDCGVIPSKTDLESAKSRYETQRGLVDAMLSVLNPELNVITQSGGFSFKGVLPVSHQLFYQYTGDSRAYFDFMSKYDQLLTECKNRREREFAKAMQQSGAFKTEYFGKGELVEDQGPGGIRITKKNETKLARKFRYEIKIRRHY
jgi:hypothetical protein